MKDPEILEYTRRSCAGSTRRSPTPTSGSSPTATRSPSSTTRSSSAARTSRRSSRSSAWTRPTHAFYLGRELMKAKLAITLGKTYRQEGRARLGLSHAAGRREIRAREAHAAARRRAGTTAGAPAPRVNERRWAPLVENSREARGPGRRGGTVPGPARTSCSSTAPPAPPRGRGPPARPLFLPLRRPGASSCGARDAVHGDWLAGRSASAPRPTAIRWRSPASCCGRSRRTPVSGSASIPGRRRRLHRLRLGARARAPSAARATTTSPCPTSCSASTTG